MVIKTLYEPVSYREVTSINDIISTSMGCSIVTHGSNYFVQLDIHFYKQQQDYKKDIYKLDLSSKGHTYANIFSIIDSITVEASDDSPYDILTKAIKSLINGDSGKKYYTDLPNGLTMEFDKIPKEFLPVMLSPGFGRLKDISLW